jgi:hypothetical protein
MKSSIASWAAVGFLAMVPSLVGCGGGMDSSGGGGGGGTGQGGGGSGGGDGGGGTGGGGGGMGSDPGGPVGERYGCPSNKPQKLYGWLTNTKTVLDSDETWTPDNVYKIFGPLSVPTTLTIQAGTVVCFDSGPPGADENPEGPPGELRVTDSGTLKVLGTASQHVVFAPNADAKTALYWGGITIGPSAKTDVSTMQYLDVYNAGLSAHGPALLTYSSDFVAPTQPPLDMQNVVFHSVQRVGLTNFTQGFTPASKVVVQSYAAESTDGSKGADYLLDYPILRINPTAAKTLTADNFTMGDKVPTSVKYVQLDHPEGTLLSGPIQLHKLTAGLAWRNTQNMKLTATLTLDPGVVFQVNRGGGIEVGGHQDGQGNIVAVGTAQDPIVFTSDAPSQSLTAAAAGDWGSLVFQSGEFDANVSKFDYVTFEYGGGGGLDQVQNCNDGVNTVYAPILFVMPADGQSYAGPSITHSTFVHSAGQAIRSTCSSAYCLTTDYTAASLSNMFTDIKVAPVEYWSGNKSAMCM